MTALDIKALRSAIQISAVIAQHVKLTRAGREWKACCPFHNDKTPSFTINDDKGFAHCFGCGWHGDVLDFVQAIERVGLRAAAERVCSTPLVYEPRQPSDDRNTVAEAIAIWRSAAPLQGTEAETYLRSRGIVCRLPDSLRFARLRYGKRGPLYPCLVALVASADSRATAVQRTYLNECGTGKASVSKPKLSLGRISGAAIRLAPVAGVLAVCEGIEDGLTLQQELGVATWVAAGAGNLRKIELPSVVRSVVIGADADDAGMAGASAAAERFAAQGRRVRIIRPRTGKDFNDQLRALGMIEVAHA